MGRPRAIQGEVRDRLLYALERGTPVALACQYAGVSESVYYDECRNNEQFSEAVTRARVAHLPETLDLVRQAAKEDWRAGAKWAEMHFPAHYRQQLELTQSGPLEISLNFGNQPTPAQSTDAKED